MDSQTTEAVNENQTTVATAMDKTTAVEDLVPVPPPAVTQLPAPATTTTVAPVQPPPFPSTPLMTPRPPTLMS